MIHFLQNKPSLTRLCPRFIMGSGAQRGLETSPRSGVMFFRDKLMQPSDLGQEELRTITPPSAWSVGRSSCYHPFDVNFNGLCGLCFFQSLFTDEIPTRLHAYKVLAENGNPETDSRFLAHLQVTFGIRPPQPQQALWQFREERRKLTSPAPGLYPVASIIWEMMGNQPPLAYPFYLIVVGMPEASVAYKLGISRYNLSQRLIKATRYAMRLYYGRYAAAEKSTKPRLSGPSSEQRGPEQDPNGAAGAEDHRSPRVN